MTGVQDALPLGDIPYTLPSYLSPSSVGTFNQCPLRYKFSKLDKIPEPSTEAQVVGSFVHEVLELMFQLDESNRTLGSARSIAKQLWEDKWCNEYDTLISKSPENEFRWKVWWCIENYFKVEDPSSFTPSGLETKVDGSIEGVPIFGIVDRWSVNDSGKLVVSDYKTGKKPKPQYSLDKKLQIIIYVELLEAMTGMVAELGELIYLKSPAKVTYEANEENRNLVKTTLVKTWEELSSSCSSGVFEYRTGPLCNWCHYQSICPAWRAK